ncbi:MAG: ATP-dependent RNA helicase DeaD [Gammaproteobacteria bacterium]
MGYDQPTPIQLAAIPPLIAGADVLGQAATGTGKTAAFGLPLMQNINGRATNKPQALVLVPTRELAIQVTEALAKYGRDLDARVTALYGGQPIGRQIEALRRGVHVVVATPGRALDHIRRGTLPLSDVKTVVLDEADEMLDMGFAEDLEAILETTPAERQTALFSATMPGRIRQVAKQHMRDPVRLELKAEPSNPDDAPQVRQVAYVVSRAHKATALGRILDLESPHATIVFCRTRDEVDQLTGTLTKRGYSAEALHGGMDQDQRDRVMGRFRKNQTTLLLATDVAARGLDIDHLSHVVNFDLPTAPESYVHRIGRVGRAGRQGVAISLCEPRERRVLERIERTTRQPIEQLAVPTYFELQAKLRDQTAASIKAVLENDGSDMEAAKAILESLGPDIDPARLVLAALKMAHETSQPREEGPEIPDLSRQRASHAEPGRRPRRDRDAGHRAPAAPHRGKRDAPQAHQTPADTGRLYVGAGKRAGVRPQDLVGAIAGESPLRGSDIGNIQVSDHFSIVEIPEGSVDAVVRAMSHTTIKGRKARVRRFIESGAA